MRLDAEYVLPLRWSDDTDLDDLQRARLEKAHSEVAAARRPAQHRQADSRFHLTVASVTGSARKVQAVT